MSRKPKSVAAPEADSDEDVNDDRYEELGKGYNYPNKLSAAERAKAQTSQRPTRDQQEPELHPLPAIAHLVTSGKALSALKSRTFEADQEAFCVASSNSGNMIAVGCRQGRILLLKPSGLELMDTLDLGARFGNSAVCTSLAFRPDLPSSAMQNVLLVAQEDVLLHVHVGTGQLLSTASEPGNKINIVKLQADGQHFATAGSDTVVHVYEEGTGQLVRTLDHGDEQATFGHSSHVYALAWKPDDPQILLSGGWDKTIQIWDLRVHRSVAHISGPHICGDALDMQGNQILTGSWRHASPLQLWDFKSRKLLTNLPFWQPEPDACLLYAAQFGVGSTSNLILAGGSGNKPCVRVYEKGLPSSIQLLGTLSCSRPVHGLEVIGGGKERVLAVCCDRELVTLQL